MPYLYTLAEEASRTGLPIERPLFLEFPDAARDHHPIDIDNQAAGEFLVGSDILVAAPPFPDKLDAYGIEFPSANWYDYWSGQPIQKPAGSPGDIVPLTVWIRPALEFLPVFVRAGAILPLAPLVQSTNETPKGPLTLRVYAGDRCEVHLYVDDGKTYAYQTGESLRMDFHCEVTKDGLKLRLGEHQGSYPAWWQQISVEIYGWSTRKSKARIDGVESESAIHSTQGRLELSIPDSGRGTLLELE